MAKYFIDLDKPIKEIPAEELRERLGGLKKSVLMRSIILNERDYKTISYDRSLRGFWYSTVKPTLDKLQLLTEKDSEEDTLSKWDAELSRYMAELVRMGELTYKDLNIVDNSRQREAPTPKYKITDVSTYGYKIKIAPYSNLIICTEKDTVYNILKDLAGFFGCSCISGKGQNSLGAMEDLLRDIKKRDVKSKPIYILALTDYDPAGYYIAETFRKQAEELRLALDLKNEVYIKRIGITPDQLTPEEVEANKYTPKEANRDKWQKATGGINGQAKGLELDALSPEKIRRLFVENIRPYINDELYREFLRHSFIKKMVLEALEPYVEMISEEIIADSLDKVQVDDFDLWELAEQGYNNIPVEELCRLRNPEALTAKVESYFI
jgi:hypothetical protein